MGGKGLACAKEVPWVLPHCTGMAGPHWPEQKGDGSLCSRVPPSPRPQALAPGGGGGRGVAVGQPTVVARQGRQDTGRGLLPAAPGPGDAAAGQGGDPARGVRGAACPPPPRPNSPNSPSGCRTQPHRPAAPCMYSYLHYVQGAQWVGAPPVPQTLEGWGQGAIGLWQPLTNTPGQDETPPHTHTHIHPHSPFLVSLDEVWGQGWAIEGGVPPSVPSPSLGAALPSSPTSTFPLGWDGGTAVLRTAVTQPGWPREGRGGAGGGLSLQPRPPLTPTRARKETLLVAALMAYTRLEDAGGDRESGLGGSAGGRWGWKGFNCCPPRPSACPT